MQEYEALVYGDAQASPIGLEGGAYYFNGGSHLTIPDLDLSPAGTSPIRILLL